MTTSSKSLVIFTLFALLWLENKAHDCGSPHEKAHKKFEKRKTSRTTPAPTPAKPIKVNFKCNTGTVPSCKCGINTTAIDDSYYYQVPKSGKCTDVFKRLSTTPSDYHFREENCHKVQRTVCRVDSYCEDYYIVDGEQLGTPTPTPDEFLIAQNTSKPFCKCGYDGGHYPMPKNGNCTGLGRRLGLNCSKAITLCQDTCYCNSLHVDPTKCDPQTCNNAGKPFCKCGIDNHYPMPKSGNCMDVSKHFLTTPTWYDPFGLPCRKARNVCKCSNWPVTYCECKDE